MFVNTINLLPPPRCRVSSCHVRVQKELLSGGGGGQKGWGGGVAYRTEETTLWRVAEGGAGGCLAGGGGGATLGGGNRNQVCFLMISRQVASGRFFQGVACDADRGVFRTAIWGLGITARRRPTFPAWANARELSCGRAGFKLEGAGRCGPGREQRAEAGHTSRSPSARLPWLHSPDTHTHQNRDEQKDAPPFGPVARLQGTLMSCHAPVSVLCTAHSCSTQGTHPMCPSRR